jgi:hypothetical protein
MQFKNRGSEHHEAYRCVNISIFQMSQITDPKESRRQIMKRALLFIGIACCAISSAYGQSDWTLLLAARVGDPLGLPDVATLVPLGAEIGGIHRLNDNFSVGMKVGDLSVVALRNGWDSITDLVPIVATGRYYFTPPGDVRVFGGLDVGVYALFVYIFNNTAIGPPGEGRVTWFEVGGSPSLGASFKANDKARLETSFDYTWISRGGNRRAWIGVTVGFETDL